MKPHFTHHLSAVLLGVMPALTAAENAPDQSTAPALPKLIYRSNGVYSIPEAAEAGNVEVLAARIKEGANVNQIDEFGNCPLHLAARKNATECLALLLQAGADPLVRNAEGQTAIQLVTAPDTIRVLRDAMVQRRLEIEICHAVARGNLRPLRTVLDNPNRKFNPNILDESNSMSLLMLACSQGDVELVKTLIAAGADVNYVSANRRSVLHIAVDHNQPAVVSALLQAGANPMQQAGNSAMPIHDAVWNNRVECVKALLPAYKNINYSPDGAHNGLPLNLAIDRGWTTVVQAFIDAGMDLNTNKYGTPPLIHAAASGKVNIVQQLLRAGADVNARAQNGQTAKDVAAPAVRHLF